MHSLWKGRTLLLTLLALCLTVPLAAQVRTTPVADTVYRADGSPAGGSVTISWNAFTTANAIAVPAGQKTVTLGTGGALNTTLAPNAGATPTGSFYTVVYHLNDGTTSREYWVIPATLPGAAPTRLAAVRNQVLPTSVAMQTVSKQYVDNAVSQAIIGPYDNSLYVEKAGDTMTGPLVLPGDPNTSLEAADKNYVDTQIDAVTTGLGGKVSLLPGASQLVTQPTGTQLGVDRLNGTLYAAELSPVGNRIATALADPDCASGCNVTVDRTYTNNEDVEFTTLPPATNVRDERGGSVEEYFHDPLSQDFRTNGEYKVMRSSRSQLDLAARNGSTLGNYVTALREQALDGGNSQYPQYVEHPPYDKSSFGTLDMVGDYFTEGQHVQASSATRCWAVGDCLSGSQIIVSAGGGPRDPSDEGTHQADVLTYEQEGEFQAVCVSGCTPGSTTLQTNGTNVPGTQGQGRYLIDTNPGKIIGTGNLVGGGNDPVLRTGIATFSGTSFPVSVFVQTAQAALSQPTDIAPGTVTLPIVTSGAPSGFSTNTAALPASSGIACIVDTDNSQYFFETAPYTVVDSTHIQFTLRKVHPAGAAVGIGGLCGYGIEQLVDTRHGIRQVFPVVGSTSSTRLLYADLGYGHIGSTNRTTTGYANYTLTVASIARVNNVVTVNLAGALPVDLNGLTLNVTGVADSSYNGSFAVTTTGATSLTYPNVGPDSTSTGGTLSLLTGSYALYPMAEVTSVYNPATQQIDGYMTLAPNNINWATGDTVEEPHFYTMQLVPDTEQVLQYMPRISNFFVNGGKNYSGTAGPGLNGWRVNNDVPATEYQGGGGTHFAPNSALVATGVWTDSLEADAGTDAVMNIHCNLHGCNRWNSRYNLFQLDANGSTDALIFDPNSHAATWSLNGVTYSFNPTAFTAPTINVGTLNATTITGGFSGSSITSGTIPAARLPLFGPSGATHAPGAVPDPGAVAGFTRFLREDGTWSVPAGGGTGGSPSGSAGGDLGGTYPNPTVTAVHATGGTLDNVAIGASTASTGAFTNLTLGGPRAESTNLFVNGSTTDDIAHLQSTGGNSALQIKNLDTGATLRLLVYAGDGNAYFQASGAYVFAHTGTTTPIPIFTGGLNSTGAITGTAFHETLRTPASSTDACTAGDFTDDANFHYVCVSNNTWKRAALSSF